MLQTYWLASPLPTVRVIEVPEVGQVVLTRRGFAASKTSQEAAYPEGGVLFEGYARQVVWAETPKAAKESVNAKGTIIQSGGYSDRMWNNGINITKL